MLTFADIIAPISEEEFFAEYFDKKPLHIPGDPEKFKGVMNWDVLNRILNMNAIWSSESLQLVLDRQTLAPAHYCNPDVDRSQNNVMVPDADKVKDWLHKGASLVTNDIGTLTSELRETCDAFEKALNVKAQANLYCSWHQRQAFASHFDTHDVYAIHFEGEKVWRVFETRMDHPIRHKEFMKYTDEQHFEQRGELLMEVTMTPGDMLYLPRGQYHDALASSSGTVHIAFGMTGVVGLDLVNAMYDVVAQDPLFRQNFPRIQEGKQAVAKHLKALRKRFSEIATSDRFLDDFLQSMEQFHCKRGGFDLPIETQDLNFQITDSSFKILKNGRQWVLQGAKGGVPIPPHFQTPVEWVINKRQFKRSELTTTFKSMGIEKLDQLILDLQNMRVIRPA